MESSRFSSIPGHHDSPRPYCFHWKKTVPGHSRERTSWRVPADGRLEGWPRFLFQSDPAGFASQVEPNLFLRSPYSLSWVSPFETSFCATSPLITKKTHSKERTLYAFREMGGFLFAAGSPPAFSSFLKERMKNLPWWKEPLPVYRAPSGHVFLKTWPPQIEENHWIL